jgi:hypothetical protein
MDALKVGDKVAVTGRGGWSPRIYNVRTVKRLMKMFIELDNGVKFSRRFGTQYGSSSYSGDYLVKFDEQLIAEANAALRKERLQNRLGRVEWRSVDADKLETVAKIIGLEIDQ